MVSWCHIFVTSSSPQHELIYKLGIQPRSKTNWRKIEKTGWEKGVWQSRESWARRILEPSLSESASSVSNFANYQEEAGIASAPVKFLCEGKSRLSWANSLDKLTIKTKPSLSKQVSCTYMSREKFCVAAFFLWNWAAAGWQSIDGARSDLRFTKMRHRDTPELVGQSLKNTVASQPEPERYRSRLAEPQGYNS